MSLAPTGNLDLGRALRRADIVAHNVFPLADGDVGAFCYSCQDVVGSVEGLAPLTRSTGVFTTLVRCQMDSPSFVCLEHLPFRHDQFEAFAPEVVAALKIARNAQRFARTAA